MQVDCPTLLSSSRSHPSQVSPTNPSLLSHQPSSLLSLLFLNFAFVGIQVPTYHNPHTRFRFRFQSRLHHFLWPILSTVARLQASLVSVSEPDFPVPTWALRNSLSDLSLSLITSPIFPSSKFLFSHLFCFSCSFSSDFMQNLWTLLWAFYLVWLLLKTNFKN